MTEAGWTRNKDAAESYADKAAIEAVRHVLGAHKLTCDEHENLQQDFKDVAQEAYQQGRAVGLREAHVFAMEAGAFYTAHRIGALIDKAQEAQGEKVVE